MSPVSNKFERYRNLSIHVLCWAAMFILPLFFRHPNDATDMVFNRFMRSLGGPLTFVMIFYVNYLWLVPKYYFKNQKRKFFLYNALFFLLAAAFMLGWWEFSEDWFPHEHPFRPKDGGGHRPPRPFTPQLIYHCVMLVLFVGLAMAVRYAQRWQHLEEARIEAEKQRTEAELSNLRNQLNPHFLLNTLNNIYALIAFDQNKAQTAVGELSKLLRHVLYENQQNFVPLYKEAEFMRNYIELMKIRVTDNVKINTNIDVANDDATPVAPLIFISLVENAFKHGVSPSGKGEINISLRRDNDQIICDISNSYFPKRENDKSGSGIGLEQVRRRLELMYPGKYTWDKGINDEKTIYHSTITINQQ